MEYYELHINEVGEFWIWNVTWVRIRFCLVSIQAQGILNCCTKKGIIYTQKSAKSPCVQLLDCCGSTMQKVAELNPVWIKVTNLSIPFVSLWYSAEFVPLCWPETKKKYKYHCNKQIYWEMPWTLTVFGIEKMWLIWIIVIIVFTWTKRDRLLIIVSDFLKKFLHTCKNIANSRSSDPGTEDLNLAVITPFGCDWISITHNATRLHSPCGAVLNEE